MKILGPTGYIRCEKGDSNANLPQNSIDILKDIHSSSLFRPVSFFYPCILFISHEFETVFFVSLSLQQYFIRFHGSTDLWNIFFFMAFSVGHLNAVVHMKMYVHCTLYILDKTKDATSHWHGVCWNNKKSEKPCSAF